MKIALYAPDSKIPNFALMKVSAYHKAKGDTVEWYSDMWAHEFDMCYCSLIFSYSPRPSILCDYLLGGSGHNLTNHLPEEIEALEPDYSLYPVLKDAFGFTTRGCIRRCDFCVVPEKEGKIQPYRDIEEILQDRKRVVLLDNNILASTHGIRQIEKIIQLGIKVDFNQGLDCRLIDVPIAKLLSKINWLRPLKMSCDSLAMIKPLTRATKLLRWYNCKGTYSIYCLIDDIHTGVEIVQTVKGLGLDPFAQPFRDKEGTEPPQINKDFARYVNMKATFKTVWWENYDGKPKN